MAKAFKKGDKVTYIHDWDRKGTVYYTQATVYSCGAKQMVLTADSTGHEMGRNYAPVVGDLEFGGTFPRMTDAEAIEAGLKLAEAILVRQREHFANCIARNPNAGYGYKESMERGRAALHEPRVIEYVSQ